MQVTWSASWKVFSSDKNRVKSSEIRGIRKDLVPEGPKGDAQAFVQARKRHKDKVKRRDTLSWWGGQG